MIERQELNQRVKRDLSALERQAEPPVSPSKDITQQLGIRDPIFPEQWHIINDESPEHMMKVTGLWEMGITGEGVITAVIDDGLDYLSGDLAPNFVRSFPSFSSYDLTRTSLVR